MQDDFHRSRRGFHALVGPDRWQELLRLGTIHRFTAHDFLLRQGDNGGFLLALHSGRVSVFAGTSAGSEVLLSFRGAGDLVGEMTLTSGRRTATVRAVERCTAQRIPGTVFQEYLTREHAQGVFSDYLVSKLSETVPYQLQQVHFDPLQRIARLLLEVLALADEDHADRMRVPLSQAAIASALGLARSTVAARIAVLRRENVLSPGPRLIVASPARLAEYARVIGDL